MRLSNWCIGPIILAYLQENELHSSSHNKNLSLTPTLILTVLIPAQCPRERWVPLISLGASPGCCTFKIRFLSPYRPKEQTNNPCYLKALSVKLFPRPLVLTGEETDFFLGQKLHPATPIVLWWLVKVACTETLIQR